MNRRSFLLSAAAVSLSPVFLTGCDTTTVSEFVSLIGTDAAALATFFGATAIATQIQSLASQISVDITNFQSGSAATDAIQAINDLISLVGTIPVAAPYAGLIVLILSALAGLLELLPQSSTSQTTAKALSAHSATPYHYGGFDKHHMTAARNQFSSAWQSQLAVTPLKK